jgi:hypothetical protein
MFVGSVSTKVGLSCILNRCLNIRLLLITRSVAVKFKLKYNNPAMYLQLVFCEATVAVPQLSVAVKTHCSWNP